MEKTKVNWISVKDRLPKDGESIFIFYKSSVYYPNENVYTGGKFILKYGYGFQDITDKVEFWLPELDLPNRKCNCYHEEKVIKHLHDIYTGLPTEETFEVVEGYCWGTREKEKCYCNGCKSDCDFYNSGQKK